MPRLLTLTLLTARAPRSGDDTSAETAPTQTSPTETSPTETTPTETTPTPDSLVTIDQGIYGAVIWLEGDQMPGTGASSGKSEPMETQICIHELAQYTDLSRDKTSETGNLLFTQINTPLVGCTDSNASGFYELELEPGIYSVFALSEDGWFCNSSSPDGVCAVTIEAETATRYTITVNYLAEF